MRVRKTKEVKYLSELNEVRTLQAEGGDLEADY